LTCPFGHQGQAIYQKGKNKKLKKRQIKILIYLPGLHKNGNKKDQETKGRPRREKRAPTWVPDCGVHCIALLKQQFHKQRCHKPCAADHTSCLFGQLGCHA